MKIIFLSGKKQCGKTSTLTKLYNELTKSMKKPPKKNYLFGEKKDFHCVFTYKNKEIAIYTSGDSMPIILEAVFLYSYVDRLIMAFNTDGPTKTWLYNNFRLYKHNKNIKKTVCKKGAPKTDKDNANLNDCKEIIKAI